MQKATLTPRLIVEHAEKFISDTENNFENDFPVSAFPVLMQQIIKATNEYLKFPIDFIGTSMLFAASIGIGNTYTVKVKNAWYERAVLYCTLVGRPGSCKTPPLKFAVDPILKRDKEKYLEYQKANKEYKQALRQGQEPPQKPIFRKTILSDFTPEALADLHSYNLRGLGVFSDEINQWLKQFSRYSNSDSTEFWLSNFSGTQINVTRKNQDPILIDLPFIGVIGGIQPSILKELQKDNRGQNGFIDRLIFAYPETLERQDWAEDDLPEFHIKNWEMIIENLLSLDTDEFDIKPIIVTFSSFAMEILKEWQHDNTKIINNTPSESLAGVYSKLENYIIRFCLILELLSKACEPPKIFNNEDEKIKWFYGQASKLCHPKMNPFDNGETIKELNTAYDAGNLMEVERIYYSLNKPTIGTESVKNAIKLVEYFRRTSIRVNSILNNTPIQGLTEEKRNFYLKLPETFTTDFAVKFAFNNHFPERSLKRFLSDYLFFERIKHGEYRKRF
jgi:hypothetical protein